jgi:hypothetical protein
MDSDVRLLLLGQSGGDKRQGGVEAPPDSGIPGIFERRTLQGGQVENRGELEGSGSQAEKWFS